MINLIAAMCTGDLVRSYMQRLPFDDALRSGNHAQSDKTA